MLTSSVALRVLHKCGWIHGDVSIGNILLHDGGTKLADMEYAQEWRKCEEHRRAVSFGTI